MYNTSEAKFSDAKAEKNFYLIKAPYPGKITAKYAEIGSYVTPSSNLSQTLKLKILFLNYQRVLKLLLKFQRVILEG